MTNSGFCGKAAAVNDVVVLFHECVTCCFKSFHCGGKTILGKFLLFTLFEATKLGSCSWHIWTVAMQL